MVYTRQELPLQEALQELKSTNDISMKRLDHNQKADDI